ncbi:MAG: ABC transporter permease [Oscillospiraceae bacterium]|nr:ABC transporter permease [Oscillospiraceae bacterium]
MRTKGWQSVFRFTFIQHIKTKTFIIGTVIFGVILSAICVLTNILPVILGADEAIDGIISGSEGSYKDFANIFVIDETGLLTDDDFSSAKELGAVISKTDRGADELINELSVMETAEALVKITSVNNVNKELLGYSANIYYSEGSSAASAGSLSDFIYTLIDRRKMMDLGVSEEDYPKTLVYVNCTALKAGSKQVDIFTGMINYIVPLILPIILFVLIISYGQTVAQSIATEKTSRVMELLLVSVRPLAVVIGKVLAMGLVSFGQAILMSSICGISIAISAPFGIMGKMFSIIGNSEIMNSAGESAAMAGVSLEEIEMAKGLNDIFKNFTPLNIILVLVIFILGFLFFSLIAALVGASISRMEDLTAAMQPFMLFAVFGMYLSYFPVIFNADSLSDGVVTTNPVQVFSYYFPLSSPFALPGAILLGTLSPIQAIIASVVLAACVVLIAIVVSKVYEAIILHNGNRIKFGDILKMAARK